MKIWPAGRAKGVGLRHLDDAEDERIFHEIRLLGELVGDAIDSGDVGGGIAGAVLFHRLDGRFHALFEEARIGDAGELLGRHRPRRLGQRRGVRQEGGPGWRQAFVGCSLAIPS